MCGRYTFIPGDDFGPRFEVIDKDLDLRPNYNVAPGAIMPVVTIASPKHVRNMRWGLVPFWSKDPKISYRLINARSEDIAAKPSFRKPFRSQRCLIPASGFYEWDHKGPKKIPYYFSLKSSPLFSFAGLFDIWKDAEGYPLYTFTILTTIPNSLVGKIHDRMPVILSAAVENAWANNQSFDQPFLESLLRPYPDSDMLMRQVSPVVNNPENNSPVNLQTL